MYVIYLCKILLSWVLIEFKIIFNNLKLMIYEILVNDMYNEGNGV